MKTITITSTVYYEEVREFTLEDNVYEEYVKKINDLSFEDNQNELIEIYEQLEDNSIEDALLETNPLNLPEIINLIDF